MISLSASLRLSTKIPPDLSKTAIFLRLWDGDSKEDVNLRIHLRSMHRSLAAAVVVIGVDAAFGPYSRLR